MSNIADNNQVEENFFASRSQALLACLPVLLKNLGWLGEKRQLLEAMPSRFNYFTLEDFLKTLNTLQYEFKDFKINLLNIDNNSKPSLFVSNELQKIYLILDIKDNQLLIYDGISEEEKWITKYDLEGRVILFKAMEASPGIKTSWFVDHLRNYNKFFLLVLIISCFLNLLALALPLFSMAIYDQVIASSSTASLGALLLGIAVAVVGTILLQQIQVRILAYVGAKFSNDLSTSVFERLLFLSANYTESASLNAQVARIKDFDSVRDFFMSPLISLLFDFPYVLLFLGVIIILSGNLVYIPIIMIGVFFVVFFSVKNFIQNVIKDSATAYNKKQELLLEILQNLRILKYCSAEDTWFDHFRKNSAETAMANFKFNLVIATINISSDFLMMLAATAIVAFGSLKVMAGQMTIGALIAVMILVWRVLVPIKIFCSSQTRFKQLRSSISQLNNLMKLPPERDPHIIVNPIQIISGDIRFNKVTFRYQNAFDPTLLGVSFSIKAGEVVAIVGRNGSGKSSIFKLILGLYKPQSGSIYIDDQDIRQMDPFELRQAISYVPQEIQIIYGTIAQNLRLAKATATDEELLHAAELAGIKEDILSLPRGLETKLTGYSISHVSASFLQKLALARAYLRKPTILLLDEPENFLDAKSDERFLKTIDYMKGHTTILMTTHRPSHLRIANQILLLHEGQIVMSGPSEQILTRLPKEFLV